MNPNAHPVPLSMGWGFPATESHAETTARQARRAALHTRAVARRRKAKKGGRR